MSFAVAVCGLFTTLPNPTCAFVTPWGLLTLDICEVKLLLTELIFVVLVDTFETKSESLYTRVSTPLIFTFPFIEEASTFVAPSVYVGIVIILLEAEYWVPLEPTWTFLAVFEIKSSMVE